MTLARRLSGWWRALRGKPREGDVVWTPVRFQDQPWISKDRPVLVVARERRGLVVLTMSTQQRHQVHRDWMPLGAGPWDHKGRESWVRLDPCLRMSDADVRRRGGRLDGGRLLRVHAELVRRYGWGYWDGEIQPPNAGA